MIQIEGNMKVNQLNRRTDIRVYLPDGSIYLLIECKAPHIAISDVTLSQISQYQKNHQAQYISMTNGLEVQTYNLLNKNLVKTSNYHFPSYL